MRESVDVEVTQVKQDETMTVFSIELNTGLAICPDVSVSDILQDCFDRSMRSSELYGPIYTEVKNKNKQTNKPFHLNIWTRWS